MEGVGVARESGKVDRGDSERIEGSSREEVL